MSDMAINAMLAIVGCGSFLLLLVLLAAPIEAAARRSPEFADRLDRFIDRIL